MVNINPTLAGVAAKVESNGSVHFLPSYLPVIIPFRRGGYYAISFLDLY